MFGLGLARAETIEVFVYSQPAGASVYLHRSGEPPLLLGKTGERIRIPAEFLSQPTLELTIEMRGRQRAVESVPVAALQESRRWPLVGSLRLPEVKGSTFSVRFETYPPGAHIQAFNSAREPAYLGLSGRTVTLDRAWLRRGSAIEVNFSFPGYQTWSETIPSGVLKDGAVWPPPGKQVTLVPTGWTRMKQASLWLLLVPVGAFLWVRVRRRPAPAPVVAVASTSELVIPGYLIEDKIGHGGMADVYRVKRDGATLALKLLHSQEADSLKRIRREIRLWRDLVHPNIVPLYDYGEVDGRYYLVMERVEGRTLRAVLEERLLPLDEGLRILDALLDGMEYAHGRGIVHRDLKPENVMIRQDGRVLILDFGLSRSVANTTQITVADKVMGTPAYLAPERLSGEAGPACDQYALGCMAYEILTGRHPLNELDDLAVVITQHLFDQPASLREFRPEVPEEVDQMVLRMLEKKPRKRFASLTEARKVLRVSSRA